MPARIGRHACKGIDAGQFLGAAGLHIDRLQRADIVKHDALAWAWNRVLPPGVLQIQGSFNRSGELHMHRIG